MSNKIRIAITLDTECDKSEGWSVQQPFCFTNILDGVAHNLQPVFEANRIRPTYLLSPEVMKHEACAAYFKKLGNRAELGTHLHSEFIAPDENMSSFFTKTFQNELSATAEFQKLENLTRLFQHTFSFKPTSFRAGRFALSRHTLVFLQELGYRVDSSVTPDTWWMRNRSHGIHYMGAPYHPYHPSEKDFRVSGNLQILEAPVAVYNRWLYALPPALKRRLNPLHKWQRVAITRLTNPNKNLRWFRPTYATAHEMQQYLNAFTQRANGSGHVHTLVMMFHSNEIYPGTSPYSLVPGSAQRILQNVTALITALAGRQDLEFVTLSELTTNPL